MTHTHSRSMVFLMLWLMPSLACTNISAKRVTATDYQTQGVRYWMAEPYLLVKTPVEVSRTETLQDTQCPTSECLPPPDGKDSAAKQSDAIGVVFLPDYCQQYALQQTVKLASLKWKVELADGWRLTSFNSEADATQVATKVLDLVSTTVKSFAVPPAGARALAAETRQAEPSKGCRRIAITYLTPGLYRLITRPNDDCGAQPRFSPELLKTETVVYWSALAK